MKRITVCAVLLTFIAALFCSCGQSSQGIGETGISAEEFDKLLLNMTDDKVNDIIGGNGKLISESEEETNDYYLYIRLYRYEGERGGYAELEFTHKVAKDMGERLSNNDDNRLSSKTNYNLE